MRLCAVLLLCALVGCGGKNAARSTADASVAGAVADSGVDKQVQFSLPASCASDTQLPPNSLVCTGLYADIVAKVLASGIQTYAPAVPLWSDGAQKQRWISLPVGGLIDNSNPAEWVFPIGTKIWKEFSRDGQRVETRLWQKVHTGYWVDATYLWNSDDSAATRSGGGDIPLADGGTYHVPTQDECEKCHNGSQENILGFSQALLGLAGASGLTLQALVAEGRLTNPPAMTSLTIGDDGTGAAAPALAWLHVNCGTTCHNGNSNSDAYAAGMLLRLDPTQLDGRPVNGFDTLKTTIGVPAMNPNWSGQIRIEPSSTDQSLLYQLISHRGVGIQMPPIATSIVDEPDDALVAEWIMKMLPPPPRDAGVDAPTDAMRRPMDAAVDSGVRPPTDAASDRDGATTTAIDGGMNSPDASRGLSDGGTNDGPSDMAPSDAGAPEVGAPVDAGRLDASPSDSAVPDAGASGGRGST